MRLRNGTPRFAGVLLGLSLVTWAGDPSLPSAAAAAQDAGVAPRAASSDATLLAAPSLPLKWRAPADPRLPPRLTRVAAKAAVVMLDGDARSLVLRDAATGAVVWRTPLPAGKQWSGGAVGSAQAIVTSEEHDAVAVRLIDGAIRWSSRGLGMMGFGQDGTGLVARDEGRCATRLVDLATGKPYPTAFEGSRKHYKPLHRGGSDSDSDRGFDTCEDPLRLLTQRAGGPIVIARDDKSRQSRVGAVDTRAATATFRWSIPFPTPHVFVAHVDERGAVVWTAGASLEVVRVDFATGRAAWRRTSPLQEDCTHPQREVRVVDGILVVQACKLVQRLDLATGAPSWTRDVGDAVAALDGETMPPDDYEAFAERGAQPLVVQWLDRATGTPRARVTIPEAAHDVALAKDGALFLERKNTVTGVMGLVAPDGAVRWRRGPDLFGYVAVGRFIATGWTHEPHDYVLLDPRSGDVVGIAPKTNQLIGALPEREPTLLVGYGKNEIYAFEIAARP